MSAPFDARRDAQLVFRQSRQAVIIVGTDAPRWTILDVNDAYLAVTHRRREDLLGRGLFEAFPESAGTTHEHGSHHIGASLDAARAGRRDVLPVQRYDIPDDTQPGGFARRYWELASAPLRAEDGQVIAVLHEASDVTEIIRLEEERNRLGRELAERNAALMEQGLELELTNQQLQENAVELEAQSTELQETAARLEEQTAEAEEARRVAVAEQARLAAVLDSMADAHATLDHDFRFVVVNAAAEQKTGKRREELIGRTHWEVFPASVHMEAWRAYHRVVNEGVEAHLTEHYVGEGYDVHLEIDAYPTPERGVALFWRDVSDRVRVESALRASEGELRLFADLLPTLAWTARPDGTLDWCNQRWMEYTGGPIVDGQDWASQPAHHPDAVAAVTAQWAHAVATGEPFEMTSPLRGRDNVHRAFLTRAVPVRNADGLIVRWLGTNTDVEGEHAARRQAEEANAAKTAFLATMSHELRTPLNALGGYLELLLMELRGPLTEAQRSDLQRMQRSHRHLLGLINDVLNFAKIDTGHAEFEITAVDVGRVLHRIEELISPQCQAKSITCVLHVPDPSPHALADGERLGQILLNLLGNAVKFTPAGGRITASCGHDGQSVFVTIEDTGAGIPREQLESIFDPFVQVGRRLNAPRDGVGLGLAISRTLAEGMDGSLSVKSTVGEGSSFTLRLPATPSD